MELGDPQIQSEFVNAVVDTGYNGSLSVTPDIAQRLELPFRETRSYELGSGEIVEFQVHDITVVWDGELREAAALVTDGGVLVGMSMMTGYTLFIDAIDGGEVRIKRRS